MTLQKSYTEKILEQVAKDAFELKPGDTIYDYDLNGDIIDFAIEKVEDLDIPLFKIKVIKSTNNKEYKNVYYDGEMVYF
jgi:D-lyxose ketol-isomerase